LHGGLCQPRMIRGRVYRDNNHDIRHAACIRRN